MGFRSSRGGSKGDTGSAGPQGATGATGSQGPAGFGTVTPSSTSRTLNSAGFQPSATKACYVSYSVSISCSISLTGGQEGKVEILSDSGTTPTTVRGTVSNSNSGTLTVGLALTDKATFQLSYLVPAGHYVILKSTNVTSTPTFAVVSQVESALG